MEQLSQATLAPEWITGFSDGEATFTYSRGSSISLYYAIKLTGIERPLLEQVQTFFSDIGAIYNVGARAPGRRSGATKTAAYFRVSNIDELTVVVHHFDRFPLQSNKRNVYEIWRMMVLLKRSPNPDPELLETLADEVTARCVSKQPWR